MIDLVFKSCEIVLSLSVDKQVKFEYFFKKNTRPVKFSKSKLNRPINISVNLDFRYS